MARVLIWMLRLAGVGLVALLIGGYLGGVHPAGDSLAVVRLWVAVLLLGIAAFSLMAKDRVWATGLGVLCLVAALPVAYVKLVALPAAERVDVIVYSKNLGLGRADIDAVVSDIEQSGADIVLLQELTRQSVQVYVERLSDLPHRHVCEAPRWSGIAIFSRWPLANTACTPLRGLATASVQAPGGAIWTASIHQTWPYPYKQGWQLPMLLDHIATEEVRRIVAGDFNMVPWGYTVRSIAEASGTRRIGQVQTTIRVRDLPIPIDHVLTNGAGEVERRPRLGSDHYGLVARIGFDTTG